MDSLWDSFLAFNINAFSNLVYELTTNWCFAVILVAMVITIVLSMKSEVETAVPAEQNAL